MKKYIGKTLLFLSFMMMISPSCTDLDEELYSQVTTDRFYQTEDDFISALGAAYTNLYGIFGNYYGLQEVSSDEMIVPQRGQDWYDGGHWVRLHDQQYTPEDPLINGGWSFCYNGINACNRLIEEFEAVRTSLEGSESLISELKVLRALYYMWLLDLYGNVPIVDRFTVPTDFLPTNNSRQEVFDFVESTVIANIDNLETDLSIANYGRITKWAAYSLLAKLYLNAEVYTGTPRWQDAVAATDSIINSGNYSLESNYFTNFETDNSGSLENIFVIPYDQIFAQGMNVHMRTLHYANTATYNLQAQPWNGFSSLQEFYNSYEDDDVRKANFLVGVQYSASGDTLFDPGANNSPVFFTPEINEQEPNARRDAGARIGKFEIAMGATSNLSNDYPIFRFGDIILMKAEALWRQNPGDGTALGLVNQVRTRNGNNPIEPFTSLTADNILAERGREMFSECYRRQDLIRFNRFNEPWAFKEASPEYVNIFPIPRPQLNANNNLNQNPGYSGQ